MSSLGTMTARLALDYSDLVNGLRSARGEMGGWQTYSVQLQNQAGKAGSQSLTTTAVTAAVMQRNTGSANAGLLRGTGSLIGSLARMGIGVASVYGSWKLHSIRMKNELMQNQLLTNMLGRGPAGGGAGSLAWLNAMRNGLSSNRSGTSSLLKNILLVSGALTGLGAAAIYGYGVWRNQSAKLRTELMQQKLLTEQLNQARAGRSIGSGAGAFSGGLMGGVIGGMMGSAVGNVAGAIASIPGTALSLASDAEQTGIAFEVMLGSGEKAAAMLAEIKAYADKSPFDLAGANEAAQKLMNYGMQAQDVMPTMRMLGDVAAGDKEKFDRLSTAFGQTTSTGRLMGQDLLQFINAGFNPLQEISKTTGESMADLKKRMEDGGISALEVRDAFVAATSEGGRFHNMTERQSKTMAGLWSTFKDSVSTSLRQVGVVLMESLDLKGWLVYLTDVMNQAPYVIANAGTLIHAELLGWGAFFAETVPFAAEAFQQIGQIISAVWDGAKASFNQFIADIRAGFEDVMNIGKAVTMLRSNPHGALGLMAGVALRRKQAENQPSATQLFSKAFTESLAKAPDVVPGSALADKWRDQRGALLMGLAESDTSNPVADFGGKLGASFTANEEGKDKKKTGSDSAQSNAALRGSEAAAKIFTSGLNRDREVKILETIAKNTAPKNPFAPPEPPTPGQAIPIELGVINF